MTSPSLNGSAVRRRGLLLPPRDMAVLCGVYQYRMLTREQIERLWFPDLACKPGTWSSSVAPTRLRRLVRAGLLAARPFPAERPAGRPALLYTLGPAATALVARELNLLPAVVKRRQRKDSALSWLWFPHRHAIAETRIAFTLGCRRLGATLTWEDEESLAARNETVLVAGKLRPIRPDGFLTISLPDGTKTSCFVEVQLQSQPAAYAEKVAAYRAYWIGGRYHEIFGRSLRVLAVTTSTGRAGHLSAIAEAGHGGALFWAAALPDLAADPWGAVWRVPGHPCPQPLLGTASSPVVAPPSQVPAIHPALIMPGASAQTAADEEQAFQQR